MLSVDYVRPRRLSIFLPFVSGPFFHRKNNWKRNSSTIQKKKLLGIFHFPILTFRSESNPGDTHICVMKKNFSWWNFSVYRSFLATILFSLEPLPIFMDFFLFELFDRSSECGFLMYWRFDCMRDYMIEIGLKRFEINLKI